METINWKPNQGVNISAELDIREVRFGEGVVQVQQKALAKPRRSFEMSFSGSSQDINQKFQTLLRLRGQRFLWRRAHTNETVLVRCTSFSMRETGLSDELNCTFKEEVL